MGKLLFTQTCSTSEFFFNGTDDFYHSHYGSVKSNVYTLWISTRCSYLRSSYRLEVTIFIIIFFLIILNPMAADSVYLGDYVITITTSEFRFPLLLATHSRENTRLQAWLYIFYYFAICLKVTQVVQNSTVHIVCVCVCVCVSLHDLLICLYCNIYH